MDMTFWLIFITRTATSLPVQTIDEILQSGEYISVIVTLKILPFLFLPNKEGLLLKLISWTFLNECEDFNFPKYHCEDLRSRMINLILIFRCVS